MTRKEIKIQIEAKRDELLELYVMGSGMALSVRGTCRYLFGSDSYDRVQQLEREIKELEEKLLNKKL